VQQIKRFLWLTCAALLVAWASCSVVVAQGNSTQGSAPVAVVQHGRPAVALAGPDNWTTYIVYTEYGGRSGGRLSVRGPVAPSLAQLYTVPLRC